MPPSSAPPVTVVVVTWQGAHLLAPCLRSLQAQTLPHRVLIVDNGSSDGTQELLASDFPDVDVLALPKNLGFAGGVARALAEVDSEYVALLNNDATADPQWLAEGVAALQARPDVASAAARMLLSTPAGTINNAGAELLGTGYGADRGLGETDGPRFDVPVEVFGASGGAAVYRTLALKAVGGFDPRYFMYYEDLDAAWRLRLAGWSAIYVPQARVSHEHAASADRDSEMFAYFNERNRLLTLYRNAPLGFALRATARFVLTTASLAVKHWLRRPVPARQVFLPSLRIRVLGGVLRALPRALAARRRSTAAVRVDVLDRWAGRSEAPCE
ncbi:glycosyltransferase [Epidermidibacterium keratini]|uniref:Glycosyltransferase n=1 Tax=Epidermidibacterium keratini TaxID=1891644 RepID=A0A7L4YVC5_9ACTN|nr:glycosyltransferase [Epidermidibacterium keratini]